MQTIHADKSSAFESRTLCSTTKFKSSHKLFAATMYLDNLRATGTFYLLLVYTIDCTSHPELLVRPRTQTSNTMCQTPQMPSNYPKSQQSSQYKNKSGVLSWERKKAALDDYTTTLRLVPFLVNR